VLNSSHDILTVEPLVSVGIPTYNRPDGLRRTLECITGQTYKNLEIIVSDNCSPGSETEAVSHEFIARDSRIQYYRQDINKGATFNFQFVLEKATGEYFMWAADDDEWRYDFISNCVLCLKENNDIGVVFTKYHVVSSTYPIFKMKHFPDMAFVSNNDPLVRIKGFLLIDENSHKANLIYGLWRIDKIKEFYSQWRNLSDLKLKKRLSIDAIAIIAYLSKYKAMQINQILFIKTYEGFPPGHVFGTILSLKKTVPRVMWQNKKELVENNIDAIKRVLQHEGVWSNRFNDVFEEYLGQINTSSINYTLKSIYRDLIMGII
jgi:glycosyltransferase involved in cell wall biosynthesis